MVEQKKKKKKKWELQKLTYWIILYSINFHGASRGCHIEFQFHTAVSGSRSQGQHPVIN